MNGYLRVLLAVSSSLLLSGCASPTAVGRHHPPPLMQDKASGGSAQATRQIQEPQQADRTPTGSEPFHGLIQYRAKDAKPAIVKPKLVDADQALIAPGTKVIGVVIGGEARAYPLFILNNHQIVNDSVGGIPLSASW